MAKVKICGITSKKDAKAAVENGADALGFIFYKKSPRYITPLKAKKIIATLPPFVTTVGVFVNEKKETVKRIAQACGLTAVQLHGDESPSYCRGFNGLKVIKAFRIEKKLNSSNINKYAADAYLFDTYQKDTYGGTGTSFRWSTLGTRKFKVPVILSGGLNPQNIKSAIGVVKPFAVDVSSGVETSPGKKSPILLKQLFNQIG